MLAAERLMSQLPDLKAATDRWLHLWIKKPEISMSEVLPWSDPAPDLEASTTVFATFINVS
jgi:hypothetical protein